jgi:hypothetical protein
VQAVGAAQVGRRAEIVPRHRQPNRVDAAAHQPDWRAAAAVALRPMPDDGCSACLLQRFVGE